MDQSKADNATPSGSQMDVASTTTLTKTSTANRRRLHRLALVMLEDHFVRVSQNPNHAQRVALLEKIKAVPGCSDYSLVRMSGWFASRRKRFRMKEQREQASFPNDNNDSRFPSLTPAAIQHLTVLASNQLHPSPELLETWTTLLASSGAIEQDVINWIHHRNQEQQPSQHPPSPSETTTMTPEPSAISQSQTQTQSTSPPLAHKQEATASPVALQLAHPDDHEVRATSSEPSPTSSTSNDELNQRIIDGVRDALASPQTTAMPNAAPKTAAEFEALFSPFEQQILLLLHTLEST